jgi:flagellar FliJ protein
MTAVLHTLLEQAERQRDGLVQALQQAQQHQALLEQQAEQLRTYRDETERRGPTAAGRSAGMEMVQVHCGFMQRLDQALLQQAGTLQAAQERCARLHALRVAAEQRVAAVRRLLERRGQAAAAEEARRDQRRSDDAAQHRRVGAPAAFTATVTLGAGHDPR